LAAAAAANSHAIKDSPISPEHMVALIDEPAEPLSIDGSWAGMWRRWMRIKTMHKAELELEKKRIFMAGFESEVSEEIGGLRKEV
jgi:hypothetical protein